MSETPNFDCGDNGTLHSHAHCPRARSWFESQAKKLKAKLEEEQRRHAANVASLEGKLAIRDDEIRELRLRLSLADGKAMVEHIASNDFSVEEGRPSTARIPSLASLEERVRAIERKLQMDQPIG